MIKLKSEADIAILREGGFRLSGIIKALLAAVKPGIETGTLDDLARQLLREAEAEPAFLNYRPAGSRLAYPAALCVSLNEEIVHGLPGRRLLRAGDIVTLDLGLKYHGLFTDMAVTVPVGAVSPAARRLLSATRAALTAGLKAAKPGGRIGDISAAIEAVGRRHNLGIVTDLAGHGVGYAVHEEPYVPNVGVVGSLERLEPGLVLAVEPMFTLGQGRTRLLADGFTFAARDGSLAAHFEATIAITNRGVVALTPLFAV